jgi:hypothetical protein
MNAWKRLKKRRRNESTDMKFLFKRFLRGGGTKQHHAFYLFYLMSMSRLLRASQ